MITSSTPFVEVNPSSPDLLLILGLAVGIAGLTLTVFVNRIRLERLIYWLSWLLATSLISASVLDRGWRSVALIAGVCAGAAFLYAYMRTSYVKIGGRVYAYTLFNSRPDPPDDGSPPPVPDRPTDAYGNFLTASKYWWTIAVFSIIAGFLAIHDGRTAVVIGAAVALVALLAPTGLVDAREGFPVCRHQYLQLVVIVAASIPVFLLPPLAYAVTYWASGGSRRPCASDNDAT